MELHFFWERHEAPIIKPCVLCGDRTAGRIAVPAEQRPFGLVGVLTIECCGACYTGASFDHEHFDVGEAAADERLTVLREDFPYAALDRCPHGNWPIVCDDCASDRRYMEAVTGIDPGGTAKLVKALTHALPAILAFLVLVPLLGGCAQDTVGPCVDASAARAMHAACVVVKP